MSFPVKTVAILTALSGKAKDLEALLCSMAVHCRSEPGNLRWDVWRDRDNAGRFVLDELYRDGAAVSAHHQTPHFKAYAATIPDLAQRSVLLLDPAEVAKPDEA